MYRVFLTNHDYFADPLFDTFEEALAWVKGKLCFEVSIWNDEKLVATWSPISGLTKYEPKPKARQIPIAKPIPTPQFEGRREYLADPATDAKRFEQVCREADIEAKKKGMAIVVFKNRENNYFTWEEKYISSANPIEALYTARVEEAK